MNEMVQYIHTHLDKNHQYTVTVMQTQTEMAACFLHKMSHKPGSHTRDSNATWWQLGHDSRWWPITASNRCRVATETRLNRKCEPGLDLYHSDGPSAHEKSVRSMDSLPAYSSQLHSMNGVGITVPHPVFSKGNEFLECIVTSDDTWIHFWTPETKQQRGKSSMEIQDDSIHRQSHVNCFLVPQGSYLQGIHWWFAIVMWKSINTIYTCMILEISILKLTYSIVLSIFFNL